MVKIRDLEERVGHARLREEELKRREVAMTKLECSVDMHKALAEQSKEFVGMIFRNQVIMTSRMENIAVPGMVGMNGGYSTPSYVSQNPATETTTRS